MSGTPHTGQRPGIWAQRPCGWRGEGAQGLPRGCGPHRAPMSALDSAQPRKPVSILSQFLYLLSVTQPNVQQDRVQDQTSENGEYLRDGPQHPASLLRLGPRGHVAVGLLGD